MKVENDFLAPCGLYCGVCGVYYATRDGNEKFLKKLLEMYQQNIPGLDHLSTADLECRGCLSGQTSWFCTSCAIKDCARRQGYAGCHECADWPCEHIDSFPMPVGKKVIMRAIPYWREHGTAKYVQDEEARYICPACGHRIFRGAKRCNRCKTLLDLD